MMTALLIGLGFGIVLGITFGLLYATWSLDDGYPDNYKQTDCFQNEE